MDNASQPSPSTPPPPPCAPVLLSSDPAVVLDNLDVGVCQCEMKTQRYIYANSAYCRIVGYSFDELKHMTPLAITHPDDKHIFTNYFGKALPGGQDVMAQQKRYVRKDGSIIWVDLRVRGVKNAAGEMECTFVTAQDITAQKNAEEALRRTQEWLQLALEAGNIAAFDVDEKTKAVTRSTNYSKLFGISSEEFDGQSQSIRERIVTEDLLRVEAAFERSKETRLAAEDEYRVRWPDGSMHWLACRGRYLYDKDGTPLRLAGTIRDISREKEAHATVERNERRYRALVENAFDVISLIDHNGLMMYATPNYFRVTGWEPHEVVGRPATTELHEDDIEYGKRVNKQVRANPGKAFTGTCRIRHKDGSWRWIEYTSVNMLDVPEVRAIVSNFRDITDRRRLEEQFLQAQKIEGIGKLAGGVAHDFNNLLTSISGFVELALMTLPADHAAAKYISHIRSSTDRAAALTQQILMFARKQVVTPRILDLNEVVMRIDQILRRLIGEDIELLALPAPNLWRVEIDPTQIEQVLLNLAVNARDAMPSGGKLTIETHNATLDSEYTKRDLDLKPGEYVMLSVIDTGVGMTPEIMSHIFEPFFTTKATGKGTGLGLATAHGVAKQNRGHIAVTSAPGKGSTFRFYLPRAYGKDERVPSSNAFEPVLGGNETILLAEDEPMVREMAAESLSKCGYEVLRAGNGVEALQIASKHAGRIHLLVTDVVMPQMGGRQLAEQMLKKDPALQVLFVSGYTEDTIVHHGVFDRTQFLPKPFTPSTLTRRVREILDQAGGKA